MTTTIGIVGSRHWSDYDAFCALLLTIPEANACGAVVSGGARGVDAMARMWAREMGRYYREYKPQIGLYRTFYEAAHARNQEIVDDLVRCRAAGHEVALIALPGPQSRGTYDTMRRAERADVKVILREVRE